MSAILYISEVLFKKELVVGDNAIFNAQLTVGDSYIVEYCWDNKIVRFKACCIGCDSFAGQHIYAFYAFEKDTFFTQLITCYENDYNVKINFYPTKILLIEKIKIITIEKPN